MPPTKQWAPRAIWAGVPQRAEKHCEMGIPQACSRRHFVKSAPRYSFNDSKLCAHCSPTFIALGGTLIFE
jgi:hypothetical protein